MYLGVAASAVDSMTQAQNQNILDFVWGYNKRNYTVIPQLFGFCIRAFTYSRILTYRTDILIIRIEITHSPTTISIYLTLTYI
jgi:hypothetical protein